MKDWRVGGRLLNVHKGHENTFLSRWVRVGEQEFVPFYNFVVILLDHNVVAGSSERYQFILLRIA